MKSSEFQWARVVIHCELDVVMKAAFSSNSLKVTGDGQLKYSETCL